MKVSLLGRCWEKFGRNGNDMAKNKKCKNGGGMARRYWKIPSESQGEKNEFPTSGEAASGEFEFFFAEG